MSNMSNMSNADGIGVSGHGHTEEAHCRRTTAFTWKQYDVLDGVLAIQSQDLEG